MVQTRAHGVLAVVRRDPSRSVVNRVLRAHLETFLVRYTDEHGGRSLPAYVERELRAVITCGDIAHGFCRVRCPCCALDLLVAFSCKSRGFCPSCGGRRMAELAVDDCLRLHAAQPGDPRSPCPADSDTGNGKDPRDGALEGTGTCPSPTRETAERGDSRRTRVG